MNKTSSTQAHPQKKADCTVCRHLFITYEARFPYACRKLSFKSQRMPHLEVLEASGETCAGFEPKNSA
jgi:hypothetical protein